MIATVMIAAALSVRILSPAADSYVSGSTMLRAQVEPVDAAVLVSFFVDGRQACSLAKAPYECDWDAGRAIVEHRIRVVAASADGTRHGRSRRSARRASPSPSPSMSTSSRSPSP